MANELNGATAPGQTCYVLITNSAGDFWNGATFETYTIANYQDYPVDVTEQGNSGIYLGDFPVAITAGGTYSYYMKRQLNPGTYDETQDPTVSTGSVDWSGTAAIAASSGAMLGSDWLAYVLRYGFKRTDKNTEVYEATTDAIQILRRRFGFSEAETETTTTDTISTLGDFKIDVESDFGLLIDVVIEDDDTANPLIPVTKFVFNSLYPDINNTDDRGYPKHFCIFNDQIQIGPVPDQTSYVYRISYSKRGGTIISTSSVPFTELYRDVLLDLTLSRLYEMLDEPDRANYFKNKFEESFLYATRRERMNNGEGTFNQRIFTI